MSYYAKVVEGKVVNVIAAETEFFDTYVDLNSGIWLQTSYNTRNGVHCGPDGQPDGGIPLRGNYAGIGFIYDEVNDVFYPPQPYPSWILNTTNWTWESPIPYPTNGKIYIWDETTKSWIEMPIL